MMVAENFVAVGSGVATIAAAVLVSYQIILLKRQEMQEYFSDFNARYENHYSRAVMRAHRRGLIRRCRSWVP